MFHHLHLSTTPHLHLSSLNLSHISQPFSQPPTNIFISRLSQLFKALSTTPPPPTK
ncbi:hypothetical protein NC653_004594 [Populus alba x Populus x berolinensis]|uniref:Uncharacterized protein n=1 Tax=Populus alba x Populus x berolinensis TaxID=444605 RepID=A0AAD6WKS7_9ROSI|nr:hypothetical protein NC653_004594 [Populus alba x Populus x berolinensis]